MRWRTQEERGLGRMMVTFASDFFDPYPCKPSKAETLREQLACLGQMSTAWSKRLRISVPFQVTHDTVRMEEERVR